MTSHFEETAEGIVYREPLALRIRLPAAFFGLLGLGIFGFALRQALPGSTWGDTAGLLLISLLPLAVSAVFLLAAFHKGQHVRFSVPERRMRGYLSSRHWFGTAVDCPFEAIRSVEVRQVEFEDGPSFTVRVVMADGREFSLGFADRRIEAEEWRGRLAALVAPR